MEEADWVSFGQRYCFAGEIGGPSGGLLFKRCCED
jgi:hypothetical protein